MVRLSVSTLALWDIREKYKDAYYVGSHDEIIEKIREAEKRVQDAYGDVKVEGVELGLLPFLVKRLIINNSDNICWWMNLPCNTIHGVYTEERGMDIEEEKMWYERLSAKNIVYHPDTTPPDFLKLLLDNFETVSIENMDNRKEFGGTVGDLEKMFIKYPGLKMTLDINHSATPEYTEDLIDNFLDKIIEVHCSGVIFDGEKKYENAMLEHVPVAFDSDPMSLENIALVHERLPDAVYVIESELVKDRRKNIPKEMYVVSGGN